MKKFILLAAVAITLAACNNEDNYIDEPVAARINATIGQSAPSRASDVTWDPGDSIGVSMSDRYLNIEYTTENGDGMFTGNTMFFRNKQEQVTITAYYPYAGSEGEVPGIIKASTGAERQTVAEQPKIDFLYAVKENVSGSEPNVNLLFSHKMSKLTLVFKNGNAGTDVSKIVSYTIEGLVHDGTFNPLTGVCAPNSGVDATPIAMTTVSVEEGKSLASLILFPQMVDKLTLKIKDSEDQDYRCELKLTDNRLAPGNNYLFTITVNKIGLSVNSSIIDWESVGLGGNAISDDSE